MEILLQTGNLGHAHALPTYGLVGQSISPNGVGMYGIGGDIGVHGRSTSELIGSKGVFGESNYIGVYGLGKGGYGVYGEADNTSLNTAAVVGENHGAQGTGVVGVAHALDGETRGGSFRATAPAAAASGASPGPPPAPRMACLANATATL